ncbi:MAG: serine/threonine-protein kinase [Planctomycetota bacterium]
MSLRVSTSAPPMSNDSLDFVDVALAQGLLGKRQASEVIDYAEDHTTSAADAALTLSYLEMHEVDAINLLCTPDALFPGYRLIGLIGCGAGGMVFRARQETLGRDVAIKTIHARSRTSSKTSEPRIQREAQAIASLNHPGIVTAFDSGFHRGRFCIAMELVEGESLADYISRRSRVDESTAWQIIRQTASALAHAADQGIVHRDIKPANLLLSDQPSGSLRSGIPFVKVADFGLACVENASQITATGVTLGTPAYVAPEQLHDPTVDLRADIYSLGATLFHLLMGFPPCAGQSLMKTVMAKTVGDDRWRDDFDDGLSQETIALFLAMTETDPEDRIADYESLIDQIDRLPCIHPQPSLDHSSHDTLDMNRVGTADSLSFDSDVEMKRESRGWALQLAVAAIALLMLTLLLASRSSSSATDPDESTEAESARSVQWQTDGFPRPLFNGASVPQFHQSGRWTVASAADGSRVLMGQEGSEIAIPLQPDASGSRDGRLRFSINLNNSSGARITISQQEGPKTGGLSEGTSSLSFILSRSHTKIEAVAHDGEHRTFVGVASEDETSFQQISIVRLGSSLSVFINGEHFVTEEVDVRFELSANVECVEGPLNLADLDHVTIREVEELGVNNP